MSKHPRKKKPVSPPTTLTLLDKIKLIGIPTLLLGILTLFFHLMCIRQQDAAVSKTVEGWKSSYHLTDVQAATIKQIELSFHGNGSPFSPKGNPTQKEKFRHHEDISKLMSSEDGARFLEAMEKSEGRH